MDHTIRITMSIDRLVDSPFQPRTSYNTTTLERLTESVAAQGILQPILCRPITQYDCISHLNLGETIHDLEIVFGHRRKRAAKNAGLTEVPVEIRSMTDTEVRLAQLTENLQRDGVNPIDEAEAIQAALANDAFLTATTLATTLGISKAQVYARLKLTELTGPARAAAADGTIGSDIAVLIARLPKTLHTNALRHVTITDPDTTARRPKPVREARSALKLALLIRPIDPTAFDPSDLTLLGDDPAQQRDCYSCPHMSTNITSGDREGIDDGMCLNSICWLTKRNAHDARKTPSLLTHSEASHPAPGGKGETKETKVATPRDKSHEEPGPLTRGEGERTDRGAGQPAGTARETPRERLAAQLALRVLRDRGERDHDDLVMICWSLLSVCPGRAIEATTGLDARAGWRAVRADVAESLSRRDGAELARVALAAAITLLGYDDDEYADEQLRLLALRYPEGEGSSQTMDAAPAGGVEDQSVDGPASVDFEPAAVMAAADDASTPSDPLYDQAVAVVRKHRRAAGVVSDYGSDGVRRVLGVKTVTRSPVKYRHPTTGETWNGKGLQPAWFRREMDAGRSISEFEVRAAAA